MTALDKREKICYIILAFKLCTKKAGDASPIQMVNNKAGDASPLQMVNKKDD